MCSNCSGDYENPTEDAREELEEILDGLMADASACAPFRCKHGVCVMCELPCVLCQGVNYEIRN